MHIPDAEVQRIRKCTSAGWLLPYLAALDAMFSKRWDCRLRTAQAGHLLDEPIPRIDWLSAPHAEAHKNLETCLKLCHGSSRWDAFRQFLNWLMWGFGDASCQAAPQIDSHLNAAWYMTFNLGLYLKYPYDYLGEQAAELYGGGKHNPTAYFPTPMSLATAMVAMMMNEKDKAASVCDPCVGSGRFLMVASNYSLNLYGIDIDPLILKACRLNMWWYVPWGVCRPKHIKGLECPAPRKPPEQISTQRAAPADGQSLGEFIQLELFDKLPTHTERR